MIYIFFGTPNHPWSIPRPQGALDALDFGREVRQVWPLYTGPFGELWNQGYSMTIITLW